MSLSLLKTNARVIRAVFEMTLKQYVTDLFIIFTVLIQPLIVALLALWMLQDKKSDDGISVVVGSGMSGLWSSLLFMGGNSITVERWLGTLETIIGVPTEISAIAFGKNLANVVQSLTSMVLCYVVAATLFNYNLHVDQPILFVITLLLTIIAFVSFGLILSPIFLLNPAVQQLQNGLEFPVYILGGFLFPIALLPGWTTPLSYVLPPYWAARALHATSSAGGTLQEIFFCWAMLLVFSVIDVLISRRLFQIVLYRARNNATLDMQ